MSTYDKLDTINDSLNDIKTAIVAKGVTPTGNITTYATAIDNIPQSAAVITSLNVTPSTSAQTITAPSGTDGYSPVNVSAVTSSIDENITAGNIKKDVTILGVTGTLEGGSKLFNTNCWIDTDGNVHAWGLDNTNATLKTELSATATQWTINYSSIYKNKSYVAKVDFSNITTVTATNCMQYALAGTPVTDIDLSGLITCSVTFGWRFTEGCSSLKNVDLSNLTTVGQTGLNRVFQGSGLEVLRLPKLTNFSGQWCLSQLVANCTLLTDLYLNAVTTSSFTNANQMEGMLENTGSDVTHTVHFPSNMESTVQGMTGYPLFGGTTGYVVLAFDLPATS